MKMGMSAAGEASCCPRMGGKHPDDCYSALNDGRCLFAQEVRRVWVGYLSQCDSGLGQKVAAKLQSNGAL